MLEFYGTIAEEPWFDDDITPKMFREELFAGKGPITIWINSPGGDCNAASQIYTALMDYKDDVTVKIDGMAASAASVIAMAGTKVLMAPTAMMMIHNPSTGVYGDHKDMEEVIAMLEEVKEGIINAYEIRTGLSHAQLSHMMDSTTWMNAKKAIEPKYICFLIDENGERLVLVPYPNKDFHSHRVPSSVYDGSRSMEICSLKLCRILAARYKWNLNRSYRVPGCIVPKQKIVVFDLNRAEVIDRDDS